jgi:hypothetical protein
MPYPGSESRLGSVKELLGHYWVASGSSWAGLGFAHDKREKAKLGRYGGIVGFRPVATFMGIGKLHHFQLFLYIANSFDFKSNSNESYSQNKIYEFTHQYKRKFMPRHAMQQTIM